MRWYLVTYENFAEKVKNPVDRWMWQVFQEAKIDRIQVCNAFTLAYKMYPFTRKKRILDIGSGYGLVDLILLRKNWCNCAYLVDIMYNYSPICPPLAKQDDQIHLLREHPTENLLVYYLAKKLHVRHKIHFMWGSIQNPSAILYLSTIQKHFQVILGLNTCGKLSDFVTYLGLYLNKNVINLACCPHKIKNKSLKVIYARHGSRGLRCVRSSPFIYAGYMYRERSCKLLEKSGRVLSYITILTRKRKTKKISMIEFFNNMAQDKNWRKSTLQPDLTKALEQIHFDIL